MQLLAQLRGNAPWAASLQFRDFRLLCGSTLLNSLGSGMEQVAVGWLIFDMTGSAFMVGAVSAARMAPFFFLGILSGAVADRVERRIFLRFITLAGSGTAGLMALLLLSGTAQVWSIIVVTTLAGGVFAFALTTRQAYAYDIVGPTRALNGLSLTAMSMQAGGICGALMSGALIQGVGPGWQYVVISACYLAAVLVLLATSKVAQLEGTRRESILQNVAGYFQIIRENRILLVLMCLAAVTEIFGFTHMTLLPVFAKEVLHLGPVGLGFLTAVRQSGGIMGLISLASLREFRRKGLLMFALATGFGVGLMAFSISSNLFLFLVVLAMVNACAMSVDTLYKTLMQDNVPDEQRGRAMGSWVLSIGFAPVGHLGVGGLASILGAPGALLINGAILTFISLAAAASLPKIRRLR